MRLLPASARILCLAVAPFLAPAQDHDTTCYVKYPDMLGIGIFETLRNNVLQIDKLDAPESALSDRVEYHTNGHSVTGFIINYDKIFLALGYQNRNSDLSKGRSKNTNLAILLKGNRLVLEAYWRSYTGFYDKNTFAFKDNLADTTRYFINENINNRTFKVKGLYFMNPNRFSFNSAYYGSCRQLRSASSWILNGNVRTGRIKAPDGLIPYYAHDLFEDYASLHLIGITAFSAGGGWTRNIVFFKRIFLNFLLTIAAEPQWRTYEFENGYRTHPFHVSAASDLRVSAGFNSRRFFLIVSSVNDRTFSNSKSITLSDNFLAVTFSAGYRFRFDNKVTRWLRNNKIYKAL